MTNIALLTASTEQPGVILPALDVLSHPVSIHPAAAASMLEASNADVVIVDARKDFTGARSLCQLLRQTGIEVPLLALLTEGGTAAISTAWTTDDFLLDSCGPAELEARLRLAVGKLKSAQPDEANEIRAAGVVIDESSYTARLHGQPLNLTYKEFELLKYLAQFPGRVFTREQLLHEVWGYDYFGGTRTVDVHVRRLRAKLGADHEQLIATVRNVGYRFNANRSPEDN
ncbi:DNA-binding response OmpR family regulator [Neomicrococcus aestuarii]|uniref:DNA-binding response OmpR family regulator n=1 Tax=Neomicrococcus aestuarii TaxID=556325 RepID=A0A7W8TV83_9MICC|nr:response regulator transcription factor [Neomicrococcus aestuarii]MBB5513519.1 DNA-binding response OmpR family regulator [Neomicrococcus aestuarii]